ncbi:MAG: hypothetical protein CVV58_05570 [Tenericutes bacterium HGW-Tenericutes-3]|nr:MAG: hypothetical protein CVV58_05570 [Tenericutes bacterium HGW-Tenericutes-3]
MNYIIPFISSFASYLIISYFIYSILGRKRTISFVILTFILLSRLYDFVGYFGNGIETKILILIFTANVMPVLLAFYAFMVVTGGMPFFNFKMKRKTLKGISSDIQTKYLSTLISYMLILGSLIFGILVYFYIEGYMKYVLISILSLSLIFGIYIIITNLKITSEQVILIIGRNKEKIYKYDIPKKKSRITINDFFDNPNYIVDPIGIANLKLDDNKLEKHYLYWIATGDQVDMKSSQLIELSNLSYKDYLDSYEKYHYRSLLFEVGRMGKAELVKNKKIK